jgi:plastocyanin
MKALVALILLSLVPSLQAAATVEGKVTLPGSRSAAGAARYNSGLAIGQPDPPAAIVYLEGSFPLSTNTAAEVSQHHYQFAPGLLAVQKGAAVKFPNLDDDYHNVFSLSKSKRFDLGRYRKGEEPATQTFTQAGVVKLYCDIHEHMRGTILVLDTPYFVKTDKSGNYKLTNLPAGPFKLKAWIDEKIIWEKDVTLKDGETLKVDFAGK